MSLKLYPVEKPVPANKVAGFKIINSPDNDQLQALTYDPIRDGITWSDFYSSRGVTGPTGPAHPVLSFCVRGKYSGGPYIKVDPFAEWAEGGAAADGLLSPHVYHEYTDFPITNPLIDPSDLLFIAPVTGFYNVSISYSKIPTAGASNGRVLVILDIVNPTTPSIKYATEIIDFDNTSTELYRNQFGSWSQTMKLTEGTTVRPYQHPDYLNNGPAYINFSASLAGKV